ncbi:hypothetical protein N5P37_003714 [Trichoderma harzianum]|uniref:Uncharacterized protein n=1 Tax=Trichoderma harzianum CBS 226.95 TaxID=983964 RepID=A0A2T4AVF0_TRIHA|nr:hypothetical protein M431DRAFT_964 [Trichoderma harzianum CBS 226.95]KAK0764315.1 hypothetical protein N5P37_003714 [Trichoderma harzianum]PKK47904.1 hypothetical protein CI102_7842 [Trichoderma harzianum]PTB61009.1 hypothetical protein M431DRAFT_964 [Trichoderma harzianum CBS 226.95]
MKTTATEETGGSEYHHFFRYVDHIFWADRERPALSTNGVTIGTMKLKQLMIQITSKVPGPSAQARLELLPHMMPDSKMPRMINMGPYIVFLYKPSLVVVPPATSGNPFDLTNERRC